MSPQKPTTTTTSSVAAVIENDLEDVSEDVIISCSSPTAAKLLSASSGTTTSSTTESSSTTGGGCNAIGSMVAVKRSPTVAPSVVPRLLAKSAAAAELVTTEVYFDFTSFYFKFSMNVFISVSQCFFSFLGRCFR